MAETLDFASPVPPVLDTRKVFRQNLIIEGCLPLSQLTGLSGLLTDNTGQAQARLQFSFDESRRRRVTGCVQATVNVLCQRCLEPVSVFLSEPVNLAFVSTETLGRELPADIDPWVCDDEEFSPAGIIEEQLILGLPIVATHSVCNSESTARQQLLSLQEQARTEADNNSQNPFAILASLKKSGD